MTEEWKAIEGYEGIYEVSSFGRVRSLDRIVEQYSAKSGAMMQYFRAGQIIKTRIAKSGYVVTTLKMQGKTCNIQVHRAVAKAFIPGYFEGAEVNHKDENKTNNNADNLEWVTRRENALYGTAQERCHSPTRKAIVQMTKDGQFVREWASIWAAHITLGIDDKSISGCCRNQYGRKSAGGYLWKFKD